ncbi:M48 family metallopeptidase [Fusobacterium perfoetens]|uniref:M48 family metallopeptidase n=1 Tax=Fusobacterium perfoetens TaxID=852 RepID=UPI00048076B8|nr:SprT family zinc-dependent metalloprotease [Fusobacterium perfoetens]MCI6153080.1 M48 family metallopeptidase [Fusobacterium perfoetens]MDY3236892.1 SprT family zinc-dependent metalloprotease [Fusobacterium perfoetens]
MNKLKLPDSLKDIEVVINRKKIKNIIIKIDDECKIKISLPFGVPNNYVEKIIEKREKWILEIISQKKKIKNNFDENFIYLGKSYQIQINNSMEEFCQLKNGKFYINIQKNSFENRKKLIDKWICENFYDLMIELTMTIGEKIGYTPIKIKFRDMKTRWGSCNSMKKSITYNHQLYKKSIYFIEYVVLHELAHIPYPHHQKTFWEFIEKIMPDWKERKKLGNI